MSFIMLISTKLLLRLINILSIQETNRIIDDSLCILKIESDQGNVGITSIKCENTLFSTINRSSISAIEF